MRTAAIRQELLTSNDKNLQKRRQVLRLSALGIVDFAFITLYQSGAIDRLPEVPIKIFDSNKVNAAPEAYSMKAPDGAISTCLYAAAMLLATVGGTEKSGRKPFFDAALGGVIAVNTAGAVYYLGDMVFKQKRVCPYCIAGAAINILSAVIIAPVVKDALRKLFSK
ncbi:MAG: vitamin K epoxide reductase family protein [Chitinophagaceae bacterium]